jgi:dynein light intermediate chain 1
MLATKRASLLNQSSLLRDSEPGSRPRSKDGPKKNIWSSMLDSVASGKKLPEKTMVVLGQYNRHNIALVMLWRKGIDNLLGGTPDSQKEFLETLSSDGSSSSRLSLDRRSNKQAPIANQFALGYTYQDVLDADQEGMILPSIAQEPPQLTKSQTYSPVYQSTSSQTPRLPSHPSSNLCSRPGQYQIP